MSDDDDKVGYKKPPRHSQFPKGKSGNPKGRPKASKNMGKILEEILSEPITLREGETVRRMNKAEAMMQSLIHKALKGDIRALTMVWKLTAHLEERKQQGPSGVLIVPGPIDPKSWVEAVAKEQAKWRGRHEENDNL